jgi:glutaconate CoA-transferase subunit B
VVLLSHAKHRLVERVSYVTSPGYGEGGEWRKRVGLVGGGPSAIITDRGVLEFDPETKEAMLRSFHPLEPSSSPEDVAARTGWPLKTSPSCGPTPTPTNEELSLLRSLDPDRFWLGN